MQFLTAALARAEETAKPATPGPWGVRPPSDHGDGWEVCGRGPGHNGSRWVVGAESGGGVYDEADARHIALHDPGAVLRRVAADRQILAEHQPVKAVGYDGYGVAVIDTCILCGSQYAPYPCRTVLLLAQAWGWEASHAVSPQPEIE
ncbi:DUF6221 family protein [Kitasatospora mediocidica]|uniref:DUF6221 family protein n=1 Tax=Kitasatospora mediocidica TaxID=58352 RepID=UPI0005637C4F|nr:DUF6221 family protein [Kitasatospora mediocidica]